MNKKSTFMVVSALLSTPAIAAAEPEEEMRESKARLSASTMLIKYSMLPSKVAINAMTDEQYYESLVESPNEILQEYFSNDIRIDFIAHKNTGAMRHFCIPYVQDASRKSTKELLTEIVDNMGNDYSFSYMLPPSILAKALKDDAFKRRLLENPNAVLSDYGFEVDQFTCLIHENTPKETHLFISEPSMSKSNINLLKNQFRAKAMLQASTGTCCATGTCD